MPLLSPSTLRADRMPSTMKESGIHAKVMFTFISNAKVDHEREALMQEDVGRRDVGCDDLYCRQRRVLGDIQLLSLTQ